MAERKSSIMGLIFQKKSLFCLFSVTSILFMLSWLFVLRLDHKFLRPMLSSTIVDGNSASQIQTHGKPLITSDRVIHEEELEGQRKDNLVTCNPNNMVLKVFMYDLPAEFHFELLDWKSEGKGVWPDIRNEVPHYPGGLNLQHSIDYWLTLDLLSSEFTETTNARSAVRVHNSSEADVIFVPFFSSLSYNRHSRVAQNQKRSTDQLLQEKLVKYVTSQDEWKRSAGKDHIVLAHHPNSLLYARWKLWPATYILSDFGRYPTNIANIDKDVIAPYKHVVKTFVNDSSGFDGRPTLLYFQGAIYRKDGGFIRQELFYLLKEEKDVHFAFGSVQKNGIRNATLGMRSSKFCLNIAGDTPSSNRLFDAIASHCVPVVISDEIELPYEDVLDYSKFCVFVRTSDALKDKFLVNLIRGIGREEWTRMWQRLKKVENLFEYQYPSKEGDAVQMIWQAVARKAPTMRMKAHRSKRFSHYDTREDGELRSVPLPRNLAE
ncbi:probable arabinosyltransferase ARAD1 [Diospyros lotus]|uniref:probable arabinosyltransferase ARAD1 n=1 Tax=Diospyros lotus TaxID=55363 RepID=UPI002253B0BB|nr:probable arabinosyltransferase ARAD1 [Diospyros lotus]